MFQNLKMDTAGKTGILYNNMNCFKPTSTKQKQAYENERSVAGWALPS